MKKPTARDLKDLNLLKHYRIIRKWACKNNDLNDADLELLIYFDCMEFFSKHDFFPHSEEDDRKNNESHCDNSDLDFGTQDGC